MPETDAFSRFVQPLFMGQLFLVADYGHTAWNNFLSEMQMVSSGVPYAELGISERRHAQLPRFFAAGPTPQQILFESGQVYGNVPQDSIAVLTLSGVMRNESAASTRGADALERDFREAYANPNISAIVLDIDSGGGEIGAGWRVNTVVGERNKPVVAYSRFTGSAAYLAAIAADEIIAGPGSEIGAIGAYMPLNKKMMQQLADNIEFIYADQSTDKNAAFRAAMKETPDYSLLRAEITKAAGVFIAKVESSRPLKESKKESTLSGGVFDSHEAKLRGLVDSEGTFSYALQRAALHGKRHKQNKNA